MRTRSAFTLLELLAGLAVVGILSTIAVVGYQSFQDNTADATAKGTMDRAVQAQQRWFSRYGVWNESLDQETGRGTRLTNGPSYTADVVSFTVGDGERLGVAVRSNSGICHAIVLGDPLLTATVTRFTIPSGNVCSGQGALTTS